ncbi:MAG: cyclic pyranopterin monophosphate synthase MoaC [Actinomycetota bacterium]|jgi:cyclic pyranopterin phosphate synthase|nr:cyclic pyranopterin monophosphate synthase MoaC [Actinomycetota bacterium]MDA8167288.1 cyclic pyranopterin monophosphate synthase MoaC [Actinomycetota bacterium]
MSEDSGRFSHLDETGAARMVDVGEKPATARTARASARISMAPETLALIKQQALPKGDVLSVARVAGIMAAKETARLIPMCHPLSIEHAGVDFRLDETGVDIEATVSLSGKTGVEMEALTAAAVAALTIYDMCKAVDREMVIGEVMLLEKRGGRSGDIKRTTKNG